MKWLLIWIFIIQLQLNYGQLRSKEILKRISSHPNWKLLNRNNCGLSYADRIIGGKNVSMGSYPWLARLGYVRSDLKPSERILKFRCGGAIITEYFILTAAHCTTNLPPNMVLTTIQLGEHNTETDPDCNDWVCNDPYQLFYPAKTIYHKSYNKPNLRNDIALLKLNKKIKFNDFVKPICLMRGKLLKKDLIGQLAEVAGWGIYNINEPQMSNTLQAVKVPILRLNPCQEDYQHIAVLTSQQMCVGGVVGKDSCGGDSGGPLMKVGVDSTMGPRYYLIGIVSFGTRLCGETNVPGIYTKASEYMLWVLDHLEP